MALEYSIVLFTEKHWMGQNIEKVLILKKTKIRSNNPSRGSAGLESLTKPYK
jgi:hypothetical protein